MDDVRRSLSPEITKELIAVPETYRQSVAVEASKSAVINELDQFLQVNSGTRFQRYRFVEVRANELSLFTYYRIVPKRIELDQVDFKIDRQCDQCFWGVRPLPPIMLSDEVRRKCDFGQVILPVFLDTYFIVSARIKGAFENAGFTGLNYEAIDNSCFLASITSSRWQRGEAITLGNYCARHRVAVFPAIRGLVTPVDEFENDFEMIRGVEVGGIQYHLVSPAWYVSRRALEVFLAEVSGLQRAAFRLNEKFKPCIAE